jgi:hypothetical protein
MFADLVGSTALSARLDPEELRDIIGAYHRCCAEVITGSSGFVAKYLGNGVLAYAALPGEFCGRADLFDIGGCDGNRGILGMGLDSTGVFAARRARPQSVILPAHICDA